MSQTETKICQNCQKEFIIEPEDFEFYQKIKVPCPNEFETTYTPDRPEIVYCEACYLAEVV